MADKAHRNTPDPRKADPAGKTRPVTRSRVKNGPGFGRKSNPEAAAHTGREGGDGPGRVESWDVARLSRHARQDSNFHPLSDDEPDRLAEDMRRNGQRTPIEVTPDGRVIDGHQRLRAARKLGWATVLVVVRYDLAGDEFAIERRMIEANLHRRQLDVLDRVRLATRMLEIEERRKPGGLTQYDEQDLRDRVGESLGMSGRNVQRYFNILRAPMAVQRAHSGGRLSMKLAEKVARLGGRLRKRSPGRSPPAATPSRSSPRTCPRPPPPRLTPTGNMIVS